MGEKEAEIFLTPDGCLYHLGVKEGEINPRILTVGDRERAKIIAEKFLQNFKEFEKTRNFRTFSGVYKGVPVSIVSIGMGAPNMDFLVREVSYLFKHKSLAFVRLGTCGVFKKKHPPGTLCLADSIYYCQRNYSFFDGNPMKGVSVPACPYLISGPVSGDKELIEKINENLKKKNIEPLRGEAMTAETFYSCQGRYFPGFDDENETLIEKFVELDVSSCEMESHQLYHLCSQRNKSINKETNTNTKETDININKHKHIHTKAASLCVGVVNRVDPNHPTQVTRPSEDDTKQIILNAAEAALDALISLSL